MKAKLGRGWEWRGIIRYALQAYKNPEIIGCNMARLDASKDDLIGAMDGTHCYGT